MALDLVQALVLRTGNDAHVYGALMSADVVDGIALAYMVAFMLRASAFPGTGIWNASTRRIGGLRFVKIGRLCLSFCICREYRPL